MSSCHWLERFRLNALAGSLCITYPVDRRLELNSLLEQALNLSNVDQAFEALVVPRFDSQRVRRTLAHAAACLALVGLEGSLAVPTVVVGGFAALLLWPLLRKVLLELKQKELSSETIELTFSSLMIQQGFTAEALFDLAIDDAVGLAQSAVVTDSLHLDTNHLLERLGDRVSLSVFTPSGTTEPQSLGTVTAGQVMRLQRGETTFVAVQLIDGSLIVINRYLDGDWRPREVQVGEAIEAGALILNGEAKARVEHGFKRDPAYALLHEHRLSDQLSEGGDGERWVDRYKRLVPPLQLGLSGGFLALGSVDAALATLQFNAVNDWEEQKLASELTAIADLRLHHLQSRSGKALEVVGGLGHVVISRSCLEGVGGTRWGETLLAENQAPGSLLALLAGTEAWICGSGGPELWFSPEQRVEQPVPIRHVALGALKQGWRVTGEDGRCWTLRERQEASGAGEAPHGLELEVWGEAALLGRLVWRCKPDRRWWQVCHQLRELGIQIHLIGSEGAGPLRDVADGLGVGEAQTHPATSPRERLQVVEQLQQGGERVGYVGSVFEDLSAMEQADVSLGVEVDASSCHVASLCDLVLSGDILWLPRLIRISRRLQQTARQNFALVGSSQLAASLATAVGWIGPLQMVLLGDVPLLLAELNNLLALTASGRRNQPSPRHSRPGATPNAFAGVPSPS
ncbi:MAG: hypothetical protein ACKOZW_13725 [Cyanobium sp.]